MNPKLSSFHEIADDPIAAIRKLAHESKRPLGYFSPYFPIELALALGFAPVRLTGFNRECSRSDASLQAYCCSLVRTTLEVGMAGELNDLEGIVTVHSCDTIQRLPGIWRQNRIHDFIYSLNHPSDVSTEKAFDFYRIELENLKDALSKKSGEDFNPLRLSEAIDLANNCRVLIGQLLTLRAKGAVSMSDCMAVTRAATLSDRSDWAEMLKEALSAIGEPDSVETDGPGLFIWGGTFENRRVMDILDNAGARIVGDWLDTMSYDFYGKVDTDGDPFENLAHYYFDRPIDATKYRAGEDKGERILKLVKNSGAEAVIFALIKFCDPNAFEYPYLKRCLDKENIPSFLFETDMWEDGSGQAATRLEAFIEMLDV